MKFIGHFSPLIYSFDILIQWGINIKKRFDISVNILFQPLVTVDITIYRL